MKLTACVHCPVNNPEEYVIFANDMTCYGYVLIQKVEFDFPEPNRDLVASECIHALNDKKAAVYKECEERVANLNEQIDKLLALPYKGN
jgi:hypothetical protein